MTYEELYSKFLELQKENSLLREKLGETFQPEITETLETPISEAEITGKVNNQSSPDYSDSSGRRIQFYPDSVPVTSGHLVD